MKKAFCLHIQPVSGPPVAEAGESLTELIEKAKTVRVSGLFNGNPTKEVTVFSSESFGGPVCRYRCIVPAAPKKKAGK